MTCRPASRSGDQWASRRVKTWSRNTGSCSSRAPATAAIAPAVGPPRGRSPGWPGCCASAPEQSSMASDPDLWQIAAARPPGPVSGHRHTVPRSPIGNIPWQHLTLVLHFVCELSESRGGAADWQELLHLHDLALHGELRKGLRRMAPRGGGDDVRCGPKGEVPRYRSWWGSRTN